MSVQFRTVARTNLKAFLDTFKASNPKLRQTHSARPANWGALPAAYVGSITDARILHSAGVRQRDVEARLVLIDQISDNAQVVATLDELADGMLDELSAAPHLLYDDSVQAPSRAEGTELDIGGVPYSAVVITLLGQIQEGRQ